MPGSWSLVSFGANVIRLLGDFSGKRRRQSKMGCTKLYRSRVLRIKLAPAFSAGSVLARSTDEMMQNA